LYVPRETGNNAYAKFGGKHRVLWDFLKWPIMIIPKKPQTDAKFAT